ncbi:hypothetical protein CTAYLR_007269 [Chrysophaeum taylorii]|uniref:t-SNARE coiled-coil homology domain-containing protein n=1 Tax=Chrysophaeum taylorii TaxID=2483200 RepID=A0AAD7UKC5_9STRA|nr:hypothetical protein CTAYLR_007269 [Chrysophaeum taylorii]
MSAATHDPFYVVKDELAGKLQEVERQRGLFSKLLWEVNTASSSDFKEVKRSLNREVRGADGQLKDLELTIDYVDRDRGSFPHIDDRELEERRKFVSGARAAITSARETISGEKTRQKLDADEAAHLSATRGAYGAKTDIEMANTNYIHSSHAQTRAVLQEQDENLEQLDGAVDRVHRMAEEIHSELKTQSDLIDNLEGELDETSEKMNFVMSKLSKLLKTKDTCQLLTIVVLTVVLIIMLLLIIFG